MKVHETASTAVDPSAAAEPGLAQVLQAVPVAIYMTDPGGKITFYNEAAAAMWGHRPVIGESLWCGSWVLRHRDGRPMAHDQCPMAAVLRGEEPPSNLAVLERPDGTRIPFVAHPVLLRDAAGNVAGAVNTMVEDTASDTQMRLSALVESTTDAIVSKNLNGTIISWNPAAERLFGYTAADAVGMPVTRLIPDDRLAEERIIIDRISRGEPVERYETLRRRKDGSLVPVELSVSPMKNAEGEVFGASKIARDITARKESEHRIRLLMREVNHRVKNQYAVILSMIRETGRRLRDPKEFERQIRERIMALSASHDLLVTDDWKGTTIFELVLAQLRPFNDEGRVSISGPAIKLRPSAVQYLGIALHELAANSVVYGVLAHNEGRIAVEWSVDPDDSGNEILTLTWTEEGGPQPLSGSGAGFGTVVLERIAPQAMGGIGSFELGAGGVTWTLTAPMDQIAATYTPAGPFSELV
ncbi:Blue-light-activated histidine kinase 1 [Rhizobiaceae bacterium]|nr:Blue-light-activated histidine kinase 1 [Rhizobiaceae bacterium]